MDPNACQARIKTRNGKPILKGLTYDSAKTHQSPLKHQEAVEKVGQVTGKRESGQQSMGDQFAQGSLVSSQIPVRQWSLARELVVHDDAVDAQPWRPICAPAGR